MLTLNQIHKGWLHSQLFTKHKVAGQPSNIPLLYNLVLENNFLIKKFKGTLTLFIAWDDEKEKN